MAAEPSTRTNDDAVPAVAAIEGLRKRVEDVRALSDEVKTRLRTHGVERLTGIQERCVEAATTRGADVVCRAPTGSGKTLAFVLPIAMMLETCAMEVKEGVLAVIVLPTRELASQVLTHAERYCGAEACALCVGGASAQPQEDAIRSRGARVVIGTPGRIKEFIERKVISLSTVKIQVLDEIDRLLDGGFEGEIDAVMKPPGTCQTLCFSATISASLSRFLDRKLVPGYAEVNASGAGGSNVGGKVEHLSFATKSDDESVGLAVVNALEHYASKRVDGKVGGQAIIFTEMKSTAERLRATLTNMFTTEFNSGKRERKVTSLHGDLPQPARDATLANLRSGEIDVLVATDVAARGLDLAGVELVVHADLPKTADTYSHRAGRAGRPGCAVRGVSLLLPQPEHAAKITELEREAKISIRRLVYIGERERVVVTGDLKDDMKTVVNDASETDKRRDDTLISDQFAMFSDDLVKLGGAKSGTKKKASGKKRR